MGYKTSHTREDRIRTTAKRKHSARRRSCRTVRPSGCCTGFGYTAERRRSTASACHGGGPPTEALRPATASCVAFWVVFEVCRSAAACPLKARCRPPVYN